MNVCFKRKGMCQRLFFLYQMFGAKVNGFCSMEPSGNFLMGCLNYGWFLVIWFVCQFVYHGTPALLWRTQNNIIEFFWPTDMHNHLIISMALWRKCTMWLVLANFLDRWTWSNCCCEIIWNQWIYSVSPYCPNVGVSPYCAKN